MRLLGSITPAQQGPEFAAFLENQGIKTSFDFVKNTDWGSENYGNTACNIWVIKEEEVDAAASWFEKFRANSQDPIFRLTQKKVTIISTDTEEEADPATTTRYTPPGAAIASTLGPITLYILLACIWIFTWELFTAPEIKKIPPQFPPTAIASPEITLQLLYDYPKDYQLAHDLVSKYGVSPFLGETSLPEEGLATYRQYLAAPFWEGIYPNLVAAAGGPPAAKTLEFPPFEKIREGEFWRLVTPIFLHGDLLHILFNMLWLVMLGKQMEKRLTAKQYLSFILFAAIFSNTCQYIMSGPNFIGYSGVLCAMIVFIWMRQRSYPWEGYHLQKGTMAMISIFILGVLTLQIAVFLLQIFSGTDFPLRIANTAHISGALAGYMVAKIKSFHRPLSVKK